MFDSGLVPLERTCKDAALFQRCRISSLRMDLFIGERSMELGDMAEETEEGIRYHWDKSDKLVKVLKDNRVTPLLFLVLCSAAGTAGRRQLPQYPYGLGEIQGDYENFAAHYRELDSPLGYQEIYNEPINPGAFFDGTPEDYNKLYEYGVTGIRQGDPEALVGGPAEAFVLPEQECRENIAAFLEFAEKKGLPLDFFSFHSYGFQEQVYVRRLHLMREVLAEKSCFNNAEIHINELNSVPPPWPYKKQNWNSRRFCRRF